MSRLGGLIAIVWTIKTSYSDIFRNFNKRRWHSNMIPSAISSWLQIQHPALVVAVISRLMRNAPIETCGIRHGDNKIRVLVMAQHALCQPFSCWRCRRLSICAPIIRYSYNPVPADVRSVYVMLQKCCFDGNLSRTERGTDNVNVGIFVFSSIWWVLSANWEPK